MSNWRHAKITDVKVVVNAEPGSSSQTGNQFSVVVGPMPEVVPSIQGISGITTLNVSTFGGTWLPRCSEVLRGINSSFVVIPAETTLDEAECVAEAWSSDFENLGRDLTHVIGWANERRKEPG